MHCLKEEARIINLERTIFIVRFCTKRGDLLKISILTATYNRAELLKKLYESILKNVIDTIEIEWLIMDDGSKDDTKDVVSTFKENKKLEIKYFYQENQGKMVAINKLVKYATGDLIMDCDSDDYFADNAFEIINEEYQKNKDKMEDIYAMCFLKYNTNGKNMGNDFEKSKTSMFDLYFKDGENGEKALVFISKVRKKYMHKLENNERFITEARMYHEMDQMYKIMCFNRCIMICEYQKEGYSKNIIKQFQQNPYGYYKYFQEILKMNMRKVKFKKRIYAIKHYILFSYLTKSKKSMREINGNINKILYIIMYFPGIVKTKKMFIKNC